LTSDGAAAKFSPMTEESSLAPAVLPKAGAEDVLYIVDISGYVFRAFFALPPLTNEKGEPTGALYGVTSMLLKLVREQKPPMLAVVMEGQGKPFRRELYAEYKANRPPAPPDLKKQMGRVREIADAYAIPCYEREGSEADDVIATLTRAARKHGHRVVIVSADKDLLQLVGDGVVMLDTMRGTTFGPKETFDKMGVFPHQVRDFLALTGDSSDNVPGVPSVGPKTASELLGTYGSLDGIYAHLDQIKKKALLGKLTEHKPLAYLSRDLVTLKDDFDIAYDASALRYGGWNESALRALYKELGFARLLDQLGPDTTQAAPKPAPATGVAAVAEAASDKTGPATPISPAPAPDLPSMRVLTEGAELPALVEALRSGGRFAICCAAEGEEAIAGGLVGIALANASMAAYLPVGHSYLGCPSQLSLPETLSALKPLFEDLTVEKISANVKRDTIALAQQGVVLRGTVFDSMLASYLLDPDLRGHDMPEIVLRRENRELARYENAAGKGKTAHALGESSFEEVLPYATAQTSELVRMADGLWNELREAKLDALLSDLELPLARVLATVERTGVRCDVDRLRALSRRVDKDLIALEKQCFELAGREFNVNSPRQLEVILFDELHLPVVEKTKTARSTNADVLEELAIMHPLPAAILEQRSLAKLKGTYLDALPREVNPRTGRIHTKFEQAVAATGRLSSNDPNLQNLPIRTEIGRLIRDAFVADEGFSIFAADYSQIELRVLAHLSGDEALTSAFAENADVHVRTAQALFNVSAEAVTREQRAAAKTVNFAVIYGQTQFALARNLRIPRGEASRYIKAFFERYHGVRKYLDALVTEARDTGAVRTLFGRRRLVRDIHAKNHAVRSGAERIAQNTPIQGSAADIMKRAMVRTAEAIERGGLKSRMLLTVHDELVFEVPEGERERLDAVVREAMEGAATLRVPLVIGTGWGESWGQAH